MIEHVLDEFAKVYLRDELRWVRHSLVDKLDGLSEYDVRRPLTRTGTNLLGLVKHLTLSELIYLGDIWGRPWAQPHPRFTDPGYRNRDSLWVGEAESRADIVDGYRRAWEHADATIQELPVDTPGHVPWWPAPQVFLFNVMVHVLTETNRHAGHADILREQVDAESGLVAAPNNDDWATHWARIDQAARAGGRLSAGPAREEPVAGEVS